MTSSIPIFLQLKNLINNDFFYRRKSAVCQYGGFLITIKSLLVSMCETYKISINIEECSLEKIREEFYSGNRIKYLISDMYDYEPYIKNIQLTKQINKLVDILITANISDLNVTQLQSLIKSIESMQCDKSSVRYF